MRAIDAAIDDSRTWLQAAYVEADRQVRLA